MRWLGALTIACTLTTSLAHGAEGSTFTFDHDSSTLLAKGEKEGGAVYVPSDVTTPATLPLVVFLHGTNPTGALHLWMGGGNAPDLRDVVDGWKAPDRPTPFLLAAPSQTAAAKNGANLWPDFDLAAFVADVETALPSVVDVDPTRIVVVAHSGAGCSTAGGLAHVARAAKPLALAALDTCFDDVLGLALRDAARNGVGVAAYYQTSIWPRPVDLFVATVSDAPVFVRRLDPPGSTNPHDDLVPLALRQFLLEHLGPDS